MRVLVGCEFSGIVRDAFRVLGHDAWSCDYLPSEGDPKFHIIGDVLGILDNGWELGVFHPPCQHLAASGARWFSSKQADGRQQRGIDFFMALANAPITRKAIENPGGIMSRIYRKPDQIIQPFWFGHEVQKATCLWLTGLPLLRPTKMVGRGTIYIDPRGGKHGGDHTMRAKNSYSPLMLLPQNQERWKIRSRTFAGIAAAMADQWGEPATNLPS